MIEDAFRSNVAAVDKELGPLAREQLNGRLHGGDTIVSVAEDADPHGDGMPANPLYCNARITKVVTTALFNACAVADAMKVPRHSRIEASTKPIAPSTGMAVHPGDGRPRR